jgi:hypothetical protein
MCARPLRSELVEIEVKIGGMIMEACRCRSWERQKGWSAVGSSVWRRWRSKRSVQSQYSHFESSVPMTSNQSRVLKVITPYLAEPRTVQPLFQAWKVRETAEVK